MVGRFSGKDDVKEETCLESIPDAITEANAQFREEANKERLEATLAAQDQYKIKPLELFKQLDSKNRGEDANDPFPKAVPIYLDEASQESANDAIYSQFHGYGGALTIYETEEGSGKFFIVDEILGDGLGSLSVKMLNFELMQLHPGHQLSQQGSMHSWHSTDKNELARLIPQPEFLNEEAITVCGCEAGDYEIDAGVAFDQVPPNYPLGIFILPGTAKPKLLGQNIPIRFTDRSYKIQYQPHVGKRCDSPVC